MSHRVTASALRIGFTLVEITVAIGTLVVVLGLAMAIMQESERATRKIARQQSAAQFCQAVLDEAVRTIRAAVAPGNFINPALASPVCRKLELSLVVADRSAPGGFSRVTLATALDAKTRNPAGIFLRREPLGEATTTATRSQPLGGERPPRIHPLIRFGYAGPPPAPGQTDYQTDWTSPTLPALIRVTVEARLDGSVSSHPDVVLQTAVIPGLIPSKPAPATSSISSKPTPTPSPTPTPPGSLGGLPTGGAQVPPKGETPELNTPTPEQKPVKDITAEQPRKVLKPEKLDEVKEAPRS